jgi:hypothetical protein
MLNLKNLQVMSNLVQIQVIYFKEIKLTISNKTLKEAVQLFMYGEPFKEYGPKDVILTNKNLTLLFDRQIFNNYLKNHITEEELIKQLDSTFYYRNVVKLKTDDGSEIDEGALWRRTGQTLVLIDDDQYVESDWDFKLFKKYE